MPVRAQQLRLKGFAVPFRRALRLGVYGWAREMPRSKRFITLGALALQGYVIYTILTWSLALPKEQSPYFLVLPKSPLALFLVLLLYYIGYAIMNAMLTSEFVRKTQLESDQIAARQIQQTLQPEKLEELPGYQVQAFYKPFREVGGDYFDVIELPGQRTLIAVADMSGKGMPAALLAANIQALVRSIASTESDLSALAGQINRHLSRYTPGDRFATAVFIALSRDSGELTYVNAGHNAPILSCAGSSTILEATGMPLGLFEGSEYEARHDVLPPGGALLLFTDGLTDSIVGENPENRLCQALAGSSGRTMSILKSLIDPEFNEDDVTILLIERTSHSDSSSLPT
jgi:serine phosphatase RsbU (regulator of sigma subunit)